MQICLADVRIRGSMTQVVANKEVSIPEIRILQNIHGGKDAVINIRPIRFDRDFNHDDHRQDLRKVYEKGAGNGDEAHGLVGRLFGAHGKLPTTLRDIGYDPKQLAEEKRKQAAALMAEANAVLDNDSGSSDDNLTEAEKEAIELMERRERDEGPSPAPAVVALDDDDDDSDLPDMRDPPPTNAAGAANPLL